MACARDCRLLAMTLLGVARHREVGADFARHFLVADDCAGFLAEFGAYPIFLLLTLHLLLGGQHEVGGVGCAIKAHLRRQAERFGVGEVLLGCLHPAKVARGTTFAFGRVARGDGLRRR